MEKYFGSSWEALLSIVIATIAIFAAIIILVRISGKRSFSKISSFDFASTIAIGSIIASGILLEDISITKAVVALSTIFALQSLAAYLLRYPFFKKTLDNKPLLLMSKGTILHRNLRSANITEDDLRSKLREANVFQLSNVHAVILERTGDLSVLHNSDKDAKLDEWLLEGIIKETI